MSQTELPRPVLTSRTTVKSLLRKHSRAVKGLAQSQQDHASLSSTLTEEQMHSWDTMVKSALRRRRLDPAVMDIYEVRMKKGRVPLNFSTASLRDE